jgi:hypothetical protein
MEFFVHMLKTRIHISLICDDGKRVRASILHQLPFIPSVSDDVAICLPGLPEGWDEDMWSGETESVWIERGGIVGMNMKQMQCCGVGEQVSVQLRESGWCSWVDM